MTRVFRDDPLQIEVGRRVVVALACENMGLAYLRRPYSTEAVAVEDAFHRLDAIAARRPGEGAY